jgi:hypothetical protein
VSLKLHQQPALEAGDPNRFALRLEFLQNLDPGFATPEEDLSWGRFQLWAGGRNLCEHIDRGEVRRGVEWDLLPLLEWLTGTWDYLLPEQRANAFAAALLMPPDLLRRAVKVSQSEMSYDLLLGLARRLKVSTDALAHHLENLGLIDETIRDGLLAQLVNRSAAEA